MFSENLRFQYISRKYEFGQFSEIRVPNMFAIMRTCAHVFPSDSKEIDGLSASALRYPHHVKMKRIGRLVLGKADITIGAKEFGRDRLIQHAGKFGSRRIKQHLGGFFQLGFVAGFMLCKPIAGIVLCKLAIKGARVGYQCLKRLAHVIGSCVGVQ